jgi:isoleucyl-tRNA synthetase
MYNANQEENEILKFWEKDKTFEKSVSERSEKKPYVFYDGPPFATGLPHYGHIVASTMKDAVPRYWTMQGMRVERKWGWDCHGLPVENIIEKNLNLNSKKDIENFGIGNFNEACRSTVLKYADEWKKTINRMGRWVDMENDYKTMDPKFMESVWWVFRSLWDKDLIYKGYKAMHICPRCVTTLSNFEVTQNYIDIKDLSVTAKFKIKENSKQAKVLFKHIDSPVYILAWTTTPWTLPGNVLLAVGHDVEYLLVRGLRSKEPSATEEYYVVARERAVEVFKDGSFTEIGRYKGSELANIEYEPLFSYFTDTPNAFRVVLAEFVTTTDGTGIVHIAPAFGEDDFTVGQRENIPLVQHVNMEGKFIPAVLDFAGQDVKPKDDPSKADIEIIKWLARNNKLFSKLKIEHSYPLCWRCDTPLLNYATTSWFVRVTTLKEQLLKNNKNINWVPEHIKDGRFGKWLEGARDWAISRSRYWGTPLPIWESEDGEKICVGSIAELEKLTGEKVTDLHKHKIDHLVIVKDAKRINALLKCSIVGLSPGACHMVKCTIRLKTKRSLKRPFRPSLSPKVKTKLVDGFTHCIFWRRRSQPANSQRSLHVKRVFRRSKTSSSTALCSRKMERR